MLGGLFVGECDFDQDWFAPGASEKRDADRQWTDITARDRDVWIPGDGGGSRTVAHDVVAVDIVRDPGRTVRWSD